MARRRCPYHVCDCGRPAFRGRVCDRCRSIDAGGIAQAEVLHHLLGGPATVGELAWAAGLAKTSVENALAALRRRGRVARAELDYDAPWCLVAVR